MTPAPSRLARAIHRGIRRLMPADVRARYDEGMDETFQLMYRDAAERGRLAVVRLFVGEAFAALRARVDWRPFMMSISAVSSRVRALRRRPGFALGVLVTLALATGALTTVFAVVDTVLLRPLPYPNPEQLINVNEVMPAKGQAASLIAPARLVDWARMNQTLTAIAGYYGENVTDTSPTDPERISARRVTPGYFEVLGTAPVAGRTFVPNEELFKGPPAIVISDALARRRFGSPAAAVGRILRIGGVSTPIVGVMPPAFAPAWLDAWLPAQVSPGLLSARSARFMSGVARMKPGVTVERALDDLTGAQRQLAVAFPATDKGWSVSGEALAKWTVGTSADGLPLVFGAIALLWLIGVTNVAGLMVVELQRRARDLAVRAAIGGSRAHLVGELVGEAFVLSVIGSAAGLGLAALAIPEIPRALTSLPRMHELALDARAVSFAVASAAVATMAFGVLPALAATRRRGVTMATLGARGGSARRHAMQSTLVVLQVAMSLLLLGGAGLLARSYANLTSVDAGFSTDEVVTFHIGARWDEDRTKVGQFQASMLDALDRTPGVRAAGFVNFLPMTGATLRSHVRVAGLAGRESDGSYSVGTRMVGHNYLAALGVSLSSGSWCRPVGTDPNAAHEALVNRQFADQFAPGEQLIGRSLAFVQFGGVPFTIAGIVSDVMEDNPQADPVPYVYTCDALGAWPDPSYVVRTTDARSLMANLRPIVRGLDGNRAVFGLRALSDLTGDLRQSPRVNAALLSIFAAAAVLIASTGLYGLFARLVSDRAREIGVRLALGAEPMAIMRSIWGRALKLIVVGLLLGVAASAAGARLIAASLYRVSPLDSWSMASAIGVLLVAGAAAVAAPAIRASRVDPVSAMRGE